MTKIADQVLGAAKQGVMADFRCQDPADPTDLTSLPPKAWEGRTIEGAELAALCCLRAVHHHGLRIEGMLIRGDVDLAGASVGHPIVLRRCVVEGDLIIRDARLRRFEISRSWCRGLSGAGVVVDGSLVFKGTRFQGPLNLQGADISGALVLVGAKLSNPKGDALIASSIQVGGPVLMQGSFRADGRVSLFGAIVKGSLEADRAAFHRSSQPTNTPPDQQSDVAFSLEQATVTGGVLLRDGCSANGRVRLFGATIGGNVECTGATFHNPDGEALDAQLAHIGGRLIIRGPFQARGRVQLLAATIGGGVVADGACLTRPLHPPASWGPYADVALMLEASIVTGSVLLRKAKVDGRLRIRSATITGSLECDCTRITNSHGVSVEAYGAKVTGSMRFGDRLQAYGRTELAGVSIGGDLVCAGGEFHRRVSSSVTSKQDGFADVALSCERTTVGGSVFVNNGFVAEGRVRFFGAMIGRDLVCPSGSFTNPDATALDLAAATIKGALVLAKSTIKGALVLAKSTIKGKLNLSWAETTRLVDDRSSWPAQLVLDGFTYKVLESPEADLGWKARHDWLQRQTPYQSHPYLQVAAVYRASGRTADARKINVERHNDRLRQRRFHPSNLPRQFLRLSVGHGYEPMRALFWALLVFVVGGLIFSSAGHYQHLLALHPPSAPAPTPTSRRCVPGYPCFNAWVYSADLILPVVNLRQRDNWYVDTSSAAGWYIKYFELFATVTGWALATVVVASFGNLIKRE